MAAIAMKRRRQCINNHVRNTGSGEPLVLLMKKNRGAGENLSLVTDQFEHIMFV